MKHLVAFIDSEADKRRLNGLDIATRMGISPPLLSVIRHDKVKSLKPETLLRMQQGFSDDPDFQKGLLVAYLMDIAQGPAANEVVAHLKKISAPLGKATLLQEAPTLTPKSTGSEDRFS